MMEFAQGSQFESQKHIIRLNVVHATHRAGASGPAGPVLAGPILREKVGVFISPQHVGVAATAIVTQRCTTLKGTLGEL